MMMTMKETILAAMRADHIPAGESGRWTVKKVLHPMAVQHEGHEIPPGTYTKLFCLTEATLHLPPGECVMTDTPDELQKHLQFALQAHGRVLITGLGLGCVLRGVLANPAVNCVVVIERSPHVIKLVQPHIPEGRWFLIQADATEWVKENASRTEFDCAWHDLWSDPDAGEKHLAVIHSGMMSDLVGHVPVQGAWAFPRDQRRLWRKCGVI